MPFHKKEHGSRQIPTNNYIKDAAWMFFFSKLQFLATESPLKMIKSAFYFTLKLFLFSRYLNICLHFFSHAEKMAWLERKD